MANYELMGRKIREFRIKHKITQAQFAEMIEMSVTYISNIETAGKAKP